MRDWRLGTGAHRGRPVLLLGRPDNLDFLTRAASGHFIAGERMVDVGPRREETPMSGADDPLQVPDPATPEGRDRLVHFVNTQVATQAPR